MAAGKYKHSILIEQYTATRGAAGGEVKTWATFISCRAGIEYKSGREQYSAERKTKEVVAEFSIRYQSGVTEKMRINYGGRYFDILFIDNSRERDRELIITGKEIG